MWQHKLNKGDYVLARGMVAEVLEIESGKVRVDFYKNGLFWQNQSIEPECITEKTDVWNPELYAVDFQPYLDKIDKTENLSRYKIANLLNHYRLTIGG